MICPFICKNKLRLFSCCTWLMLYASCNPLNSRIASEHDEFAWLPNALLLEQNDKTIVVSIKRHGDVYSYKENHGSATKAMVNQYYLESYDAANMQNIAEKKIDINDDRKRIQPQIIGKDADRIWIFTDQLRAYHSRTLELVVDQQKIEEKNPGLKDILLDEEKYYDWDNEKKVINITAANGTFWQLNTQSLEARPYAASSENKATKRKRTRQENLWRSGSERAFKCNQDTAADVFYGLYSIDELPVYANTFRNDAAGSSDAVRSLWFTSIDKSDTRIIIDRDSLKSLSDKKFINGFFLVSRHTFRTFRCSNPSGLIIAYKTAIGKNGLINLARIATDGKEVWNIEANIKKIKGLDFTNRYMLILASDDDQNNLINKIYSIRLTDGKMSETSL